MDLVLNAIFYIALALIAIGIPMVIYTVYLWAQHFVDKYKISKRIRVWFMSYRRR